MKHKTIELTCALLDCAVAKANGQMAWTPNALDGSLRAGILAESSESGFAEVFSPSTNWSQGGPIIEREKIGCYWIADDSLWRAGFEMHGYTPEFDRAQAHGPTQLVAAMRSFVLMQLGEELDL